MRLSIGMVTLGLAFDGNSLNAGGLGGSETAFISVARELAKLGHDVRCFCECHKPGIYEYGEAKVHYFHHSQFVPQTAAMQFDVLISSRWPHFLTIPVPVGVRALWLHDMPGGTHELMTQLYQTDVLLGLSDFHISQYVKNCPELKDHFFKTCNGVDLELIESCKKSKVQNKLIWTSRPERGLDLFLERIFPKLLKSKPDLKLYFANYDVSSLKHIPPPVQARIEKSYTLAAQMEGNVVSLGHLNKQQLYQQISSSKLWVYSTDFPEISPVRGDTLIETLQGQIQIKDLVGKKDFLVYSRDAEGKLSYSNVRGVFLTRKNAPMLKVTFVPGRGRNARKQKTLYLTPDHEVMLSNGTYCRADQLSVGSSLMAFHRISNGWGDGYDQIGLTNHQIVPEHRFVAAKSLGRDLLPGELVDHKNRDTHDNDPSNLKVWPSQSDHRKDHWKDHRMNEGEYESIISRYRSSHLERFQGPGGDAARESCSKAGKSIWNSLTPEDRAQFIKERSANKSKEAVAAASRKNIEHNKRKFGHLPYRNRELLYTLYVEQELSTVEIGKQLGCHSSMISKWLNEFKIPIRSSSEAVKLSNKKKALLSNHHVISIEEADPADAYCMEVEPDHNFVANGIVVHNCIGVMEAQACGTPVIATKDFALTETVGDGRSGILIDGSPYDDSYVEAFVAKTLELLDNQDLYNKFSHEGPLFVRECGYDWTAVAKKWSDKFLTMMEDRWKLKQDKIIQQLERNNDLVPAKLICNSLGHPYKARLQEKIKTAGIPQPQNTKEVVKLWETSMLRFNACSEFLKAAELKPTKVLDFASGFASFGLYLKKQLPDCSITVIDADPEVVDILQGNAKDNNLEVIIEKASLPMEVGDGYDLIFVGNYLDTIEDPQSFLESIAKKLSPTGHLLVTTRVGPQSAILPEKNNRIWNFSYQDFVDMFSECSKFSSTFVDDKFSDGGDLSGHWLVLIKPDGKFGKINLRRRMLTTRPYQSLAVCMITKNEEDWISGCLRSVHKIADVINIADSKSEDATVEIAKKFGATVRLIDFDTFSQARNVSIDGITADWILWIDSDERLMNPDKIRKYLHSEIFNGYSLKQTHLIADVAGHPQFDLPIRLFKNKPQFKFVGAIHEHSQDVSDPDNLYNNPIHPAMVLDDCYLAHFGYIDERTRRAKCSNRNMQLLQRDIEEYGKKGRQLTWVLVIRDYLNMVKWDIEKIGFPIKKDSKQHKLLQAAVDTYLEHFRDGKSKYEPHAFPMYQEALKVLGMCGLNPSFQDKPPFEIGFALVGSPEGELNDQTRSTAVKGRWFVNNQELLQFIQQQSVKLLVGIGRADEAEYYDLLKSPAADLPYTTIQNPAAILSHGVGVV